MRANPLPWCAALLLAACGGGGGTPDATCRPQTPELQYRIHHDVDTAGGHASPAFNVATAEVAARFDAAILAPVACGHLDAVRFYWWPNRPVALSLKVYGAGSATAPGALLQQQAVTSLLLDDWNVVPLETPVALVEGEELWLALEFTMAGPGYATFGMDLGPREPGVNFFKQDGAWAEFVWDSNVTLQALVYH